MNTHHPCSCFPSAWKCETTASIFLLCTGNWLPDTVHVSESASDLEAVPASIATLTSSVGRVMSWATSAGLGSAAGFDMAAAGSGPSSLEQHSESTSGEPRRQLEDGRRFQEGS